jgi:hypothetical protein
MATELAIELAIKRNKCIDVLHTVGIKLKYFATEKDAQFLIIYKRILHVMNRVLRLNDLNALQYYTIYVWFKDELYKTPWDQDALSRELLYRLSKELPCLLANNNEHSEEIRKCFGEEITNNIIVEIDRILELELE